MGEFSLGFRYQLIGVACVLQVLWSAVPGPTLGLHRKAWLFAIRNLWFLVGETRI